MTVRLCKFNSEALNLDLDETTCGAPWRAVGGGINSAGRFDPFGPFIE
jgi:hypothetical protein